MTRFAFANLARGDERVPGVLVNDTVHVLERLVPEAPRSFEGLLPDWDHWCDAVESSLVAQGGTGEPCESVAFAPAGAARPALYCAGANYRDHVAEMDEQMVPKLYHFVTPPGVLNHNGGAVLRPGGVELLDYEVELAVVIGRPARSVAASDAMAHVVGYTIANDVSVRDPERMRHPIFGLDWMAAKSGEGLTPLGPAVVPARYVEDPYALDLRLTVNDVVRQDGNTRDMAIGIAEQIEAISAVLTLEPGDVVLTGTCAGTAAATGRYLMDGDVMRASIQGLGTLTNTIFPATRKESRNV